MKRVQPYKKIQNLFVKGIFCLFVAIVYCSCAPCEKEITTVILVRHADRLGHTDSLNVLGYDRSIELAEMLANSELDAVFSTKYNRTMSTAKPIAEKLDMEIIEYNPSDLLSFAQKIKKDYQGKNVLVVGHSNTTPQLVNQLVEGSNLSNIDENEYDIMYVINLGPCESQKSMKLEYGKLSP